MICDASTVKVSYFSGVLKFFRFKIDCFSVSCNKTINISEVWTEHGVYFMQKLIDFDWI